MQEGANEEPPKEITEKEIATLSSNISNCLSAITAKIAADKETASCVEECVIATEELSTLNELVRSEVDAACEIVVNIGSQLDQLGSLFNNIDQLAEYVAKKKEELKQLEANLAKAEKQTGVLPKAK